MKHKTASVFAAVKNKLSFHEEMRLNMSEQIKKWEYQIYSLGSILKSPKDEELMELLDEWGEDGWELVSTVRGESTNRLTLIAKRPLTDRSRRERSRPSY